MIKDLCGDLFIYYDKNMNPSSQSSSITKNQLDRLHETATRYKSIVKIIIIISHAVLLLGILGAFSVVSILFGFFFRLK